MKKYLGIFALGFTLAFLLPLKVTEAAKLYLSMAILVGLATSTKIILDLLRGKKLLKDWLVEITGNLLLSTFLVYISKGLNIPLYYAAIIYFGTQIFEKTGEIRYFLLEE